MLRVGKPLARLARILNQLVKDSTFGECQLVLGTPLWQYDGSMNDTGLEIKDTTDLAEYYALLRTIDIAVYLFDENDYFYRPSGTVADAASCGTHIVCNELPVISHQVTSPVCIGATFRGEAQIPLAIQQAIDHRRSCGQDNHYLSRESRDIASVTALFDKFLEERSPHA